MRYSFKKNLPYFLVAALCIFQAASIAWGASKKPSRVIDAHTHTYFDNENERTSKIHKTKEEFFRELKEANVVGAIAHTKQEGKHFTDLREQNVFHCYGLGKRVNTKDLEEGLRSRKFRCIKVYLGYVHQYAYDRHYKPAYDLAKKYKVPVVFHTGDTYSDKALVKYAHPLTIDEVAVAYPDVKFVIAHAGNPWIRSAAEVAYKNPNVYLDGSAFLIGKLQEHKKENIDRYVIQPIRFVFGYVESPKKLMFGSDWPLVNIKDYISVFKEAIPEEHWDRVFYLNAAEIFNFKQ